ncbi:MAG: VWA domain-containing protein, partial [Spirochaetales bacterium]|nr:VWA domain-containing protein [Spirochaetales bacterium]
TIVVDVSSEMRRNVPRVDENSLSRLKLVQYGLMKLADSLKPGDIINLVTFKGEAWVVCRGLVFDRDENTYLSAVANLETAGYADLAPALASGYEIAQKTYDSHKINSLILITSQEEENQEIDKEVIEGYTEYGGSEGITLSCLGIGTTGDESYLKSLAEAGKGTFFSPRTKTDMIRTFGDRFYAIVKPAFKNLRFRLDFPSEMLCDVPAEGDGPDTGEDCEPDDFSYNTKTYFFQGFKTLSPINLFHKFFTLTISYTDAKTGIDTEVVYKKPAYTILGRDSKALREAECVLLFTELYAARRTWSDLKPLYEGLSAMYFNYYNYSQLFNEYTYLIQLSQGEKLTINPKRLDFGETLLDEEQVQTINLTSTLSLSDIMVTRAHIVYPDVLGFGYNSYGAMGIGSLESYSILGPTGVEIDNVKSITSSRLKSFFLKNDGTLWACGENNKGSLGIGSLDDTVHAPRQVKIHDVAAVSPSENHTLFLKTDGSLWVCGENRFGQMGSAIEPGTLSLVPVKMVDSRVVAISAGLENSFYIMEDGSLWATGANQAGQLGTGDKIHRYQPERVVDSGVISVSAGETHTLILKTGNSLWGCGDNYYCALGPVAEEQHPDFIELFPEGIQEIAAGSSYSLILKDDGSLWRVGRNTGRNVVTYYYYYGYYYSYFPDWECLSSSGVVSMKAGSTHCMFMKEDGSLWGQGRNRSSELLTGRSGYLFEPTQIYASGIRDYTPSYHFSLVLREPSPPIFTNYRGNMFMLKAPGEEEIVDIGFTPPEEGLYTASLVIETNLPDRYRQVIPLNGIGTKTLPTPTPEPTVTPEPSATPVPTPEITPKPTPTPLPWTGDLRFDPKITTVSLDATSFQTSLVLDLPADTLGAYGFDIYYDPAVVYVSESEESEWILAGADVSTLIANGDRPGVISIAGFEIYPIGPGTDLEICIINWHPLAAGTTELNIRIIDMVNENYQPFGVSEVRSAGTIVITEPY